MASHVLCLNETRISSLKAHPNLQATLLGKFNVMSYYDGHGTIMFFHDNMKLFKSCIFTDSSAEFITALFNDNTSSPMNIITIYKPQYLVQRTSVNKRSLKYISNLSIRIFCLWLIMQDSDLTCYFSSLESIVNIECKHMFTIDSGKLK
jgi:hypothetical protein